MKKQINNKMFFGVVLGVLLLIGGIYFGWMQFSTHSNKPSVETTTNTPQEENETPTAEPTEPPVSEEEQETPSEETSELSPTEEVLSKVDEIKESHRIVHDYQISKETLSSYKNHNIYKTGKKDPFTTVVEEDGNFVNASIYAADTKDTFEMNPLQSGGDESSSQEDGITNTENNMESTEE